MPDENNPEEMLPVLEAERRLEAKGVTPPPTLRLVRGPRQAKDNTPIEECTPAVKAAEEDYIVRLERETSSLPVEFWPPAEYEWAYSADKIEKLFQRGMLGKTKYNDWKKGKTTAQTIGAWQCRFCPFKKQCVPTQDPKLAYQVYDLDDMMPVADE